MRNFIAIVVGLVLGYVVIVGLELLSLNFYSPPTKMDNLTREEIKKMIELIPVGALLMIAFAHFFGTLVGGIVALRLSQGNRMVGYIFGIILLILTVINVILIPHPLWYTIIDIVGIFGAILIYLKLVQPIKK